jgi:two-component system, chemotaxis family, sensor kinase CheA
MIDDEELREIFKAESEEHLASLERGLLHLEQNPGETGVLEEVFREAHSLKGSARMLGVTGVEVIAHRFEDVLGRARRGESQLTPDMIDRLYGQLDAIRELVKESVTGEVASVDVALILSLIEETGAPTEKASPEVVPEGETERVQHPAIADIDQETPPEKAGDSGVEATGPGPRPATQTAREEFRIETIRVDTRKLDDLIRQAGELAVTRQRMTGRLRNLDFLIESFEGWKREDNRGKSSTDVVDRMEHLGVTLNSLRSDLSEDHDHLELIASQLEDDIRTIRLLPLSTVFNLFARTVRDLARDQEKDVRFVVQGGDITADKLILEEIKDPLMHMIRNAVDHGIESPAERKAAGKPAQATVRLGASRVGSRIVIELVDDGRGLNLDRIRETALQRKLHTQDELASMTVEHVQQLIFVPGFSTNTMITDVSGRGVGLDVVRKNVENLKGAIEIESEVGKGCIIRVSLPVTVATSRVLLVQASGQTYALPVEYIQSMFVIEMADIFTIEGRMTAQREGKPLSITRLSEFLALPSADVISSGPREPSSSCPCVALRVGPAQLGILVDDLLGDQEVVVRQPSAFLSELRHMSGTTILGTGEICIVLNPGELIASAQGRGNPVRISADEEKDSPTVILLAEDSLTTRTQERRILERAGYQVVTAVDGLDAYNKSRSQVFDGIISDVEMPNMTGLVLTEKIRQDPRYAEIPVILVTSLAKEADRQRGLEAGANAYITKGSFDQRVLLDTLERLL